MFENTWILRWPGQSTSVNDDSCESQLKVDCSNCSERVFRCSQVEARSEVSPRSPSRLTVRLRRADPAQRTSMYSCARRLTSAPIHVNRYDVQPLTSFILRGDQKLTFNVETFSSRESMLVLSTYQGLGSSSRQNVIMMLPQVRVWMLVNAETSPVKSEKR